LYDLLKPHVTKLVVCDPRRNALLQEGNQNDRLPASSRIAERALSSLSSASVTPTLAQP
jgi:hypothetical protein